MKKRIISLLLAFAMAVSLVPAALAAPGETPPYSLQYLDGIEGSEYMGYKEIDDHVLDTGEAVTQVTMEGYDVLDRYLAGNSDWQTIIDPFCQRFLDAGFDSWTAESSYDETDYYFENGTGDRYVILGEKFCQQVINESGIVYIMHAYSTGYIHEEGAQPSPDAPPQAAPGLENFMKSQTYTPGQFTDVPADAWYASSVQTAYELGLVAGVDTNTFAPTNPISIAETLVLACRLHNIYWGGDGQFTQGSPWYQVYVDYAAANGIIAAGAFTDYSAPANRQIFAYILANALPESGLPESPLPAINSITAENIPDSGNIAASFLPGVLRLYNAGILTGSDAYGSFNAASSIQRSEVAAIAARMAIPGERKTFTPQPKPAPAPAPETPAAPTTGNKDIPDSIAAIVPASAPTTVLDSSASKSQIKKIYHSYMSTMDTSADFHIGLAASYVKSGSRAWDRYLEYVAKGQENSITAQEYKAKATSDNVEMMKHLQDARIRLEAIMFGASLYPDFFSEVAEAARAADSSLHSLAMSPNMYTASIRLITLEGDMALLELAIDNAKAKIDALP